MVNIVPLPKHGRTFPTKYGERTESWSCKLPLSTKRKIKESGIDVGRIIYDVVNNGFDPYQSGSDPLFEGLARRLIRIFILEQVNAGKYLEDFLDDEIKIIAEVRKEIEDER